MSMGRTQLVIAAVLAVGALGFALRSCHGRLNTWPMVNSPPQSGAVVCFGDSLVSGVGADTPETTYPAWLGQDLHRTVTVFGVPGETAAEGWDRLRRSPEVRGGVVIVTLGGNDLLRQVHWETTAAALGSIFEELQRRGALVVFTGVEGPLGRSAGRHRALCRKYGVLLVPDVLGGILNQEQLKADYVHPNGEGYRLMAERVGAALRPFLPSAAGRSRGAQGG